MWCVAHRDSAHRGSVKRDDWLIDSRAGAVPAAVKRTPTPYCSAVTGTVVPRWCVFLPKLGRRNLAALFLQARLDYKSKTSL
jgi:hypothetical protein